MAGEPIDRTTIKIEADASSVPAQVEPAKQAIGGGLTQSLNAAKKAAFGLLTTITSIVGTAASFYRLGGIIREEIEYRLKSGAERAKELTDSLDMTKGAESVATMQKRLDELNSRIAASLESPAAELINAATGDSIEKMKAEASDLVKSIQSVGGSVNAGPQRDREKKEREDAQRRADNAAREMRALQIELADEELKIKMQTADRIDDLRKKAAAEDNAVNKRTYEVAAELAKKLGDKRLDEYRAEQRKKAELADKEARDELDRAQKLAREQARAFEQAFKQIRADAANAFPTDQIAAQMGRLADVVEAIEQRVQAGFQ